MSYDPTIHHRRSIRLRNFNYKRDGLYDITISTQGRRHLFGHVARARSILNTAGAMIEATLLEIIAATPGIELVHYKIMPNHVHLIVALFDSPVSIPQFVGHFKSLTTVRYCRLVREGAAPAFDRVLWLRNYYEHVIRCEQELLARWRYIEGNPARWEARRAARIDPYEPERLLGPDDP